jgi:ubiquinone biosynthesis protein UbiJ
MSWEDWEETLKSKVHTSIIETPKEEKQPEWQLESTSEEVIEEEIQHVRDKVDKLEKKLKK